MSRLGDDRAVNQLVRFGVVGVGSNLLAFGLYALITWWGVPPTVTMTLVYVTAATVGFVGNRNLTFAHRGNAWSAGGRYVLAHSIGFAVNFTLLAVLVDRQGYSHLWVQAFAIVVVACYLFVAFKFFVFASRPEASQGPTGSVDR